MRSFGTGVAVGVGGTGVAVGGTGVALGASVGAAVGVDWLKPPQPHSTSITSSKAALERMRAGLERCAKLVVQLRFFAKVRHLALLRTRLGRPHYAGFLQRIN